MYKNQLQELAQRSCFNLPSYTCIREGPDHAPRFKATVNFNGEVFESPSFCTTLRQAEHSAAEVALHALANRGPSHSLAARILDETGVYKNLLQEIAQRVGAPLPSYKPVRSGLGHLPVFTCTVELAGIIFTGEPAKNKKQAEKNAAMAAWSSLKQLAKQSASSSSEPENNDEQEQIIIARALLNYRLKEKMAMANNPNATPFPKKFPIQPDKKPSLQPSPSTGSKILPLIRPKSSPRIRPTSPAMTDGGPPSLFPQPENRSSWPQKFPAAGAAPYVPVRHYRMPCHGMAPPVTIRTAVPVFSAPPLPPPAAHPPQADRGHQLPPLMGPPIRMASPVRIRPVVPVFAAPPPAPAATPVIPVQVKEPPAPASTPVIPVRVKEPPAPATTPVIPVQVKEPPAPASTPVIPVQVKELPAPASTPVMSVQAKEPPPVAAASPPAKPPAEEEENVDGGAVKDLEESTMIESLKQLEI